jgi:hypothetical protein
MKKAGACANTPPLTKGYFFFVVSGVGAGLGESGVAPPGFSETRPLRHYSPRYRPPDHPGQPFVDGPQ